MCSELAALYKVDRERLELERLRAAEAKQLNSKSSAMWQEQNRIRKQEQFEQAERERHILEEQGRIDLARFRAAEPG